jgi:phosphohistidine swiveling domain-containing protein
MVDLYSALQPHVKEAAARAATAAAAEQQAAQDDVSAAASRDKQISLTLMGLPNVVRAAASITPLSDVIANGLQVHQLRVNRTGYILDFVEVLSTHFA